MKTSILAVLLSAWTQANPVVQAPRAPGSFTAPIAGVFARSTPADLASLQSASPTLGFLARANPDLSFGVETIEPAQLERLEAALAQRADLPLDSGVLLEAAWEAERTADEEVRTLLAEVQGTPIHHGNVNRYLNEIKRIWAQDLIYLKPERRLELKAARERLVWASAARKEAIADFQWSLARKIHAGAFTFSEIAKKDQGGWVLIDHSPLPFPTLEAAVDARLKSISDAAPGPWSLGPLYQLSGFLRKYETQRALENEGGLAKQGELLRRVEAAEKDMEAKVALPPSPALAKALGEFKAYEAAGRLPSLASLNTMLETYGNFFRGASEMSLRYRIADWLVRGKPKEGYPAWATLDDEVRMKVYDRLRRFDRRTIAAAVVSFVGGIAAAFLSMPILATTLLVIFTVGFFLADYWSETAAALIQRLKGYEAVDKIGDYNFSVRREL